MRRCTSVGLHAQSSRVGFNLCRLACSVRWLHSCLFYMYLQEAVWCRWWSCINQTGPAVCVFHCWLCHSQQITIKCLPAWPSSTWPGGPKEFPWVWTQPSYTATARAEQPQQRVLILYCSCWDTAELGMPWPYQAPSGIGFDLMAVWGHGSTILACTTDY